MEKDTSPGEFSVMIDKIPFLQSDDILLYPYSPDDVDLLFQWFNNPIVNNYFPFPKPLSRKQLIWVIDQSLEGQSRLGFIIYHSKGQPIGMVEINGIDWINRKAQVEISIGEPTMWGKGYGTSAMILIIEYARNSINLHRLWLRVLANNQRARHVYEKVGFILEGIELESVYKNGEYCDECLYGLVFEEGKI